MRPRWSSRLGDFDGDHRYLSIRLKSDAPTPGGAGDASLSLREEVEMPCSDSLAQDRMEQEAQMARNLKAYGLNLTDRNTAVEMACEMARAIHKHSLQGYVSPTVNRWIEAHRKHDESQGRKW